MLRIIVVIIIICAGINYYVSAKGYSGSVTDHFDGKKFYNLVSPDWSNKNQSIENVLPKSSMFSFFYKKLFSSWGQKDLPNGTTTPKEKILGPDIVVTYVNHSTMLIQTEGLNILTDPVWSKRISPFSFFGPSRHMQPGIDFNDLPHIDIVLLSHNHYDHMDLATLKKIYKRDNPVIYTGLGNKKYLEDRDISNIFEMDWGDKKVYSDSISIEAVPAQHFSGRSLTDRNNTLWLGFVIRAPKGDIYFAGDTGYGPFIDRIKKAYPNGFRLAFLPIGAYEPRGFMKEVHMNPDDAINMYKDLGVQNAIAIHFGTFDLALEGQNDPADRIKSLLGDDNNKGVNFNVLWNGQSMDIK